MIKLPPATRGSLEAEASRLENKIGGLQSEIATCEIKLNGIRAILGTGDLPQEVFEERAEGTSTTFVERKDPIELLFEKLESKENQMALLGLLATSEDPLPDEEVREKLRLEGTHAIAGLRGAINKQAKNIGISGGQLILHKEERDEGNSRLYHYYLAPESQAEVREWFNGSTWSLKLPKKPADSDAPTVAPSKEMETMSKADFVRRFVAEHKGCRGKDILEAAAAVGIVMRRRYLYAVVGRLHKGREIRKRKHRLYATEKMKSVGAPG